MLYSEGNKELIDLLKLAEEYGVRVGVENKNEISAKQIQDALKSVESPNVGVTFDVEHAFQFLKSGERVARFITNLGKMIIHTHIHDEDKEHNIAHAPIGMGDIDYIKIVKALKEIGYQGCLMLEISPSDTQRNRTFATKYHRIQTWKYFRANVYWDTSSN